MRRIYPKPDDRFYLDPDMKMHSVVKTKHHGNQVIEYYAEDTSDITSSDDSSDSESDAKSCTSDEYYMDSISNKPDNYNENMKEEIIVKKIKDTDICTYSANTTCPYGIYCLKKHVWDTPEVPLAPKVGSLRELPPVEKKINQKTFGKDMTNSLQKRHTRMNEANANKCKKTKCDGKCKYMHQR